MVLSKAQLARYFYLAPSEIERMPYWEYELFREKANEVIEEENKQQEEGKNDNKYKKDVDKYMHNMPSYSRLSGDLSAGHMPSIPSIPSMPSFSGI